MPAQKRKRPRGVVDTSVLVAGIAGLKSLEIDPKNPSAKLLRDWIEGDTFVWLVSDEILLEYKRVLGRLGVRRPIIGKVINLLREEAEHVPASALPGISPDPGDDPFCGCAEVGQADFIVNCATFLLTRLLLQLTIQAVTPPSNNVSLSQGDLLAVAAIVVGFGLTAIMFRVQREIYVKEEKKEVNWVAFSDYLIFASIFIIVFLVVVPLLAFSYQTIARPASVASIILQAGYIPAILAHYRITFGKDRDNKGLPREKGEPAERLFVWLSALVALLAFVFAWQQPHQ